MPHVCAVSFWKPVHNLPVHLKLWQATREVAFCVLLVLEQMNMIQIYKIVYSLSKWYTIISQAPSLIQGHCVPLPNPWKLKRGIVCTLFWQIAARADSALPRCC
jgi:hypothetical protein